MKIATISNKRRRVPLIDKNLILNITYTTLLTVKYCKEAYARLKKECETTSSGIIRKRCRALMAKMSESKLSSERIAAITGCSRNFVDNLIHVYNNDGIDSVLTIATIPGHPGRLKGYMGEISKRLESEAPVYVDADQTKTFLEKVRQESGDAPVSIVLDNARYQHCQAVKDKAAELGIDLVFLPSYSPNLNIIERLWKYTRHHVLAGKYFESPRQVS